VPVRCRITIASMVSRSSCFACAGVTNWLAQRVSASERSGRATVLFHFDH